MARTLIDDLSHDWPITGPLLTMSALVIANAGIGALGSYVLRRTAESVVLGARRTLSSYLLRLRIAAVDSIEPGDLMARFTSDTTLLREVTTDSLVGLGTGGLTLIATLVVHPAEELDLGVHRLAAAVVEVSSEPLEDLGESRLDQCTALTVLGRPVGVARRAAMPCWPAGAC